MLHLLTTCEKTIRDESVAYCFLLKWEKKKQNGNKKSHIHGPCSFTTLSTSCVFVFPNCHKHPPSTDRSSGGGGEGVRRWGGGGQRQVCYFFEPSLKNKQMLSPCFSSSLSPSHPRALCLGPSSSSSSLSHPHPQQHVLLKQTNPFTRSSRSPTSVTITGAPCKSAPIHRGISSHQSGINTFL